MRSRLISALVTFVAFASPVLWTYPAFSQADVYFLQHATSYTHRLVTCHGDGADADTVETACSPRTISKGSNGSLFYAGDCNGRTTWTIYRYDAANDEWVEFDTVTFGVFSVLEATGDIYIGQNDGFSATASVYWKKPAPQGATVIVSLASDGLADVEVDPVGEKLYWVHDSYGIWRANLDGSGQELFADMTGGHELVVHSAEGKLYWLDGTIGDAKILKADLADGANLETVAVLPSSTQSMPLWMSFDTTAGEIYWTDGLTGNIRVLTLAGVPLREFDVGTAARAMTVWTNPTVPVEATTWGRMKADLGSAD